MPKLPILSGKELIKALAKIGFQHVRTTGSHAILNKIGEEKGKTTVPVPLHREIAKGTLNSIIKQANITREKLFELLYPHVNNTHLLNFLFILPNKFLQKLLPRKISLYLAI
ncbi:MAG: type II toxin-antitoxin system HicA family toxin [Nanoarchaeota archaeon]|nr:type II toxin-antitoxin system HicA family toxin [Nanoarchaeota archaeon]